MVGLDFGSTTTSAMVTEAQIEQNSVTGRMELGHPKVIFQTEPCFTPFLASGLIDHQKISDLLDEWFAHELFQPKNVFTGGTIITGLAAEKRNASAIAEMVKDRIGETIIATAADPCLESWLAFMGAVSYLSKCHDQIPITNLDIGGGTTNPALGINGNVSSTGSYFIGARHFRFREGTYLLESYSPYGKKLLEFLNLDLTIGDDIQNKISKILDYYVSGLEAIVTDNQEFFTNSQATSIVQFPFHPAPNSVKSAITFSGGVGEMLYKLANGVELPGKTFYGDLGIDLAYRIFASPLLTRSIKKYIPEKMGRATVSGLALHSTEVSGTSVYISDLSTMPLTDLPIVAKLSMAPEFSDLKHALHLVSASVSGACVQIIGDKNGGIPSISLIKEFGSKLAKEFRSLKLTRDKAVVLIIKYNIGKTLGNYATEWGRLPVNLIVIDEVSERNAHFVNIGKPKHQIIPVSYFGIH